MHETILRHLFYIYYSILKSVFIYDTLLFIDLL